VAVDVRSVCACAACAMPDALLPGISLAAYFTRIRSVPVLDPDQEQALGRRVQAGDSVARTALAIHNLRLAAHHARRFYQPPRWFAAAAHAESVWTLDDAIQVANLGLWRATATYDPDRGRFTTYASWWIRQALLRAYHQAFFGVVLPTAAQAEYQRYRHAVDQWQQTHPDPGPPPDAALAVALGWPVEKVAFWRAWDATQARPLSLDHPGSVDDSDAADPLGALIATPEDPLLSVWERMRHHALHEAVEALLLRLSPREQHVLRLRFGIGGNAPLTLQEVGQILHVSRERVRQIEAQALRRLATVIAPRTDDYRALLA